MVEAKKLNHWLVRARGDLSAIGLDRRLIGLIVGDVGAKALSLLANAYLARLAGTTAFGQIAWAQAIVGYASIPADCGLAAFGTREVARNPDTLWWYTRIGIALRFLLGTLVFSVTMSVGYVFIHNTQLWWILVASAAWLLPNMLNLEWAIQGLQRVELVGLIRLLTGLSLFAAMLLWGWLSSSPVLAAATRAVAEVVAVSCHLALVLYFVRTLGHTTAGYGWAVCLRKAAPFMFATIFTSVYAANLDTILIGLYRPYEHVGWYAAAFRLYLMLVVLPKLLIVFYYPRFARSNAEGLSKLQKEFQQFLALCTVFGLPLIALTFVLSPEIIAWLNGPQYVASTPLLRTLCFGAASLLLAAGLPSMLMATDHSRPALICYGTALVLSVTLNLMTIPKWGEQAAAVTTVISETSVLVTGLIFVRRHLSIHLPGLREWAAQLFPVASVLTSAFAARVALVRLGVTRPFPLLMGVGIVAAVIWGLGAAWFVRSRKRP